MRANFQPLVTLPGEEEIGTLHIGGGDVGVPLSDGSLPIGDVRNRSYFSTDRGLQSLEYLLNRARSQLMASGRAVTVSWDCSFERAKQLSCRKNALLHDPRLPGGQALGKIVKYSLGLDGESGKPRWACRDRLLDRLWRLGPGSPGRADLRRSRICRGRLSVHRRTGCARRCWRYCLHGPGRRTQ